MDNVIEPPQTKLVDPITAEEAKNPYYIEEMDWYGPSVLASQYLMGLVSMNFGS